MRVTDRMGYEQVTRNLQKNRTEMSDLQNQAATQKKVTKPSDDPIAAARVLSARTEQRGSQQFVKNIDVAKAFLEFSDQSLSEMSDALMRMKELAIGQSNDAGASAETRRAVAEEVQQTFSQAVQIGNRKLGERFIFGGHQTTKPPFNSAGVYQGDGGDLKIHVNKDSFIAMNLPGDRVFLGKGISADGMIRAQSETPKTAAELLQFQHEQKEQERIEKEDEQGPVPVRSLASNPERRTDTVETKIPNEGPGGINVLQTLKDFEISLRVNDKEGIQESIDHIDDALSQIIHARSQVGARLQVLTHATDSLQKAIVDNKVVASQLEDADLFQVASDIARSDSTLKATLETSGKVVQPSLLDFLK